MTQNTRIHDRFTGYTMADCDCKYCLHYGGKRKGCALRICCCTEERAQALTRGQAEKGHLIWK